MIAIIDYGVGNLFSLKSSLSYVGADACVTGDSEKIGSADKIILPGVGAFGDAIKKLKDARLDEVIISQAGKGKPIMGICLGMQLLFEGSDEAPGVKGLGFFKGQVKLLRTELKIPHMGWNKLELRSPSPLLKGAEGEYVYFVHSFHAEPENRSIITSVCDYGMEVTASVGRGNVQAFQFHPEKSSRVGMHLLKNFVEL